MEPALSRRAFGDQPAITTVFSAHAELRHTLSRSALSGPVQQLAVMFDLNGQRAIGVNDHPSWLHLYPGLNSLRKRAPGNSGSVYRQVHITPRRFQRDHFSGLQEAQRRPDRGRWRRFVFWRNQDAIRFKQARMLEANV
jgi:hypothetical protein